MEVIIITTNSEAFMRDRKKLADKFQSTLHTTHKDWTGKTTFTLDSIHFRQSEAITRATILRKQGYSTKVVTKKSTIINGYGVYKKK
jgi:hypothetical protein